MTAELLSKTPWSGVISLVGMVACLVSSAVVVGVSKGDAVTSWRVQPAVLLAILSGASSILFASALESGIAVRFWLGASNGTHMSQLHYIWDHGRGLGLVAALRAGSKARTVALLATASYLMQFLAGPLLQRSTYQTLRDNVSHESMSIDMATRIPDGWFGDKAGAFVFEFRNGFHQIQEWWRKDPIATQDRTGYTCNGDCSGYVRGAGFSYQCWTTQEQLDLSTASTDNRTVFLVSPRVAENVTGQPFLRLLNKYLSDVDSQCLGTIQVETCYLSAATVEYPISVQNSTVSLRNEGLTKVRVISSYASPGDSPKAPENSPAGPLLGLRTFASTPLADNATKDFNNETNRSFYHGPGTLSDIFFVPSDRNTDAPEKCRLKWTRPTEYVLAGMYEYMFRCALAAGNGIETQTFTVKRTSRALVFEVDAGFLAASMTVLACGIALVGALMWNWWLLGRPVTLSPLETATALSRFVQDQPHATIGQILAEAREAESGLREPRKSIFTTGEVVTVELAVKDAEITQK